ncbi:PREDICTED: dynamin-related protein 4C-like isoform X2 [Ipomoea nil]|uniref:dynamin-related protein 4C-like isoform X1 n=1 Tax=Ipomoea nil TaxID=35883 RepID=UPI000901E6CE|nr:PREDICTED: dynamin-related protein 4C-like isoform X1 [Ipomoea nil]XP_019164168.1 PREDICTED: dynamin-related protein 4C-like isoform X2 [Ipomoea nil]
MGEVSTEELPIDNAPIISSYNGRIRPLLDCIDKLRDLNIMQEGIHLPTIVVVGDQSSGKSSVLESLAGISLPRGQGISTRVPLILRLQNQPNLANPEIHLEYNGKVVPTGEPQIAEAITLATEEIAGRGKRISHSPLTLLVKKSGVPDLTMVDLPGITRVPVQGQPDDIYEQISNIIIDYITSEESIILNVLSATVDFPTCESIRMSRIVDKTGERTLAVVTKADLAPQGLLEKVTADEVKIGLGYVCVRNRIGSESFQDARNEEANLFQTHPLLSRINKSMVTVPVLADKLVRIQESIISKCLPDIVKKIKEKLATNLADLNRLPPTLTSMAEALTALVRILNSSKNSLRKILVTGDFEEYSEETDMHCTIKLMEMLNQYTAGLKSESLENNGTFLMDEIAELETGLRNFLPHRVLSCMLQGRLNKVSVMLVKLVGEMWDYIEAVVIKVLVHHAENCPQLQSCTRRAAENLIAKKKEESINWVMQMIGMEKFGGYTCNPDYLATYNNLMRKQGELIERVFGNTRYEYHFQITEIGANAIQLGHLRSHQQDMVKQAFDIKMRMVAYWKIVQMRLVDSMALHILFQCQKLVDVEMEEEVVKDLSAPHNGGIERMLDEPPIVAEKRQCLSKSVEVLEESRDVVAKIMDRITLGDE